MQEDVPDSPVVETQRASDETFLRSWLFDRDQPCPLCGYNLRGLSIPRCPESGQLIKLSVALAEPYLKAWVALIVALLLPAGFGLVFSVLLLFVSLPREGLDNVIRDMTSLNLMQGFCLLHVLACVPLSVMAIFMRTRFLRCNRGSQTAGVWFSWIALAVNALYMFSQLR
jgi:hypothetical protein